MRTPKINVLVLAGGRPGGDALARSLAVPHKAALPIGGRPMAAWVVDALRACPAVGQVSVAANWAELALPPPEGIEPIPALGTIGATVEAALDAAATPLLVTTVDHPLLTPAMIAEFLGKVPEDADCAVAVARAETVLAAYPETRRTFLRFRDARVTGCNLFLLNGEGARPAVRYWTRMDAHRKDPAAMVRAVGLGTLALWSLGLLTLAGAARALSRRVGARLAVVEMGSPEAAIDVDKPEDLELARLILARRGAY